MLCLKATMRRFDLATLFVATGCAASGSGSGSPPPLLDRYDRVLSAQSQNSLPLAQCQVEKLDLGPTAAALIRRFPLVVSLPTAFAAGPIDLPIDSLWHPLLQSSANVRGWWYPQEWLPGFYIESARFYRWSRAETAANAGGDVPTTLIQLVPRTEFGTVYPVVLAHPPWVFNGAEECLLAFPAGTARVLRFSLRHPTMSAQWGVMAAWRVRGHTIMRLLAFGPDPSVQTEVLHILRQVRRH
jgi:hypothetical protein